MKKTWIRLEYDLLEDRRIKNIVNAFGMKGLGLYIMLRLLLEHYSGRGMHVSDAISAAKLYCSERIASYILIDSGAFERDDWNFVRTATCVHTGVHAGVHAGVREGVREGEPLESSKEDILSSSSISSSSSSLSFSASPAPSHFSYLHPPSSSGVLLLTLTHTQGGQCNNCLDKPLPSGRTVVPLHRQ